MKRKEFKLLIENWNSLVSEGFDDDYMSGNLDDPDYLSKMRDETEGVELFSEKDIDEKGKRYLRSSGEKLNSIDVKFYENYFRPFALKAKEGSYSFSHEEVKSLVVGNELGVDEEEKLKCALRCLCNFLLIHDIKTEMLRGSEKSVDSIIAEVKNDSMWNKLLTIKVKQNAIKFLNELNKL